MSLDRLPINRSETSKSRKEKRTSKRKINSTALAAFSDSLEELKENSDYIVETIEQETIKDSEFVSEEIFTPETISASSSRETITDTTSSPLREKIVRNIKKEELRARTKSVNLESPEIRNRAGSVDFVNRPPPLILHPPSSAQPKKKKLSWRESIGLRNLNPNNSGGSNTTDSESESNQKSIDGIAKMMELKEEVSKARESLEREREKIDISFRQYRNKSWNDLVMMHMEYRIKIQTLEGELKELRRNKKKKKS